MAHVDPRVAGAHVGDRQLVVVQADDASGDVGDQVGAITLAAAGLQHVAVGAAVGQPPVDHLMATEPVVLLGEPRHRALAGQRQGVVRTHRNAGYPDPPVGERLRATCSQITCTDRLWCTGEPRKVTGQ